MKKVVVAQAVWNDLADGFWFYEEQKPGLGAYFRDSIVSELYALLYLMDNDTATVYALFDLRRDPEWIRKRLENQ